MLKDLLGCTCSSEELQYMKESLDCARVFVLLNNPLYHVELLFRKSENQNDPVALVMRCQTPPIVTSLEVTPQHVRCNGTAIESSDSLPAVTRIPDVELQTTAGAVDPGTNGPGLWTCKVCTLQNQPSAMVCGACETNREIAEDKDNVSQPEAPSIQILANAVPPDADPPAESPSPTVTDSGWFHVANPNPKPTPTPGAAHGIGPGIDSPRTSNPDVPPSPTLSPAPATPPAPAEGVQQPEPPSAEVPPSTPKLEEDEFLNELTEWLEVQAEVEAEGRMQLDPPAQEGTSTSSAPKSVEGNRPGPTATDPSQSQSSAPAVAPATQAPGTPPIDSPALEGLQTSEAVASPARPVEGLRPTEPAGPTSPPQTSSTAAQGPAALPPPAAAGAAAVTEPAPVQAPADVTGPPAGSAASQQQCDCPLCKGIYKKERHIGRGATGDVFLATRGAEQVALKQIHVSNTAMLDDILIRAEQYQQLRHRHIIEYKDCFAHTDEFHARFVIIAMPYFSKGEITSLLESSLQVEEKMLLKIGVQVADALCYLHTLKPSGIVHRDIKPENLLWDGESVVLTDLETVRFLDTTYVSGATGTYPYQAPEVIERDITSAKADVWALGCVLYVMATKPAFPVIMHLEAKKPDFPKWLGRSLEDKKYSKQFVSVLRLMLDRDPQKRLSAGQARDQLHQLLQ